MCEFRNEEDEVIAVGSRKGCLYYLKCTVKAPGLCNYYPSLHKGTMALKIQTPVQA